MADSTFYDYNWTVLQKMKYLENWFKNNSLNPTTITFAVTQNGTTTTVTVSGETFDGTTAQLSGITFDSNAYTFATPVVTTLAEGESATVSSSIDDNGVVTFYFGIPIGATGAQGIQGESGLSIYHVADTLTVEGDTTVANDSFTLPTGYSLKVGDLCIDDNGVLGQIYTVGTTSVVVRYIMTLKGGGTGTCYRHNITLYFNRDSVDCGAVSFTLINTDSSTSYEIPKNTTYSVSGIVYPNSSTAQVATRLTVSTSGTDTIYTVAYWDYPSARQLTFNFTSNDTILEEQTVEVLTIPTGGSSKLYCHNLLLANTGDEYRIMFYSSDNTQLSSSAYINLYFTTGTYYPFTGYHTTGGNLYNLVYGLYAGGGAFYFAYNTGADISQILVQGFTTYGDTVTEVL